LARLNITTWTMMEIYDRIIILLWYGAVVVVRM